MIKKMNEEEKIKEYYKMAQIQVNSKMECSLRTNEKGELYLEFSDGSIYMPEYNKSEVKNV